MPRYNSATPLRLFDPAGAGPAWDPARPTVGAVIDIFLAAKRTDHQAGLCEAENLASLESYLGQFRDRFGAHLVADARSADLSTWLAEHPTWKSPSTLAKATGSVVTAFRWAEDERYIACCPYSRRSLRLPAEQPRRPISEDQYRSLMRHARQHHRGSHKSRIALRIGVYFLWQTGARTCEMREADWSHVDWERAVLDFGAEHKTGKRGKRRLIPVPAGVMRLLRLLQRRGRTTGKIFRNGRGQPWTKGSFGTLFRKYARRAGIPRGLSAYCLRHGFICKGLEAGVGERQLADVTGHVKTDKIAWYGKAMRQKAAYLNKTLDQVHGRKKKADKPPASLSAPANSNPFDNFKKLAAFDSRAAAILDRCERGELTYEQAMLAWLGGV